MIADSHLHTCFSTDSESRPEDMIEQAIRMGMKELYLTDHLDMDYPQDPETGEIPFQLDMEEYRKKTEELREAYRKQTELRFGVELGLQKHLKNRLEDCVRRYPFDFVIGSLHLLDGKDPYYQDSFPDLTDEELYRSYFRAAAENIRNFHEFQAFGHLDYVVRYGKNKEQNYSYAEYHEEIDEILRLLVKYGIALEVNTGGLKYGLGFPNPHPEILKRYRMLGGELVTVGSDAHEPRYVGYEFETARELLKEAGFRYYTQFRNRRPIFRQL